jgi:hypothetical protein
LACKCQDTKTNDVIAFSKEYVISSVSKPTCNPTAYLLQCLREAEGQLVWRNPGKNHCATGCNPALTSCGEMLKHFQGQPV